jgi:hypothetical protein
LQSKADTDRQRAGNERDLLQVDTQRGERERDCRDPAEVAEDRHDRELQARLDARARQELLFEPALHHARDDQQQDQGCRGGQDLAHR